MERLISLSDSVFAFALTLLAVQFLAPNIALAENGGLTAQLLGQGPKYLSYIVSFTVIAAYWWAHQRIFSYIERHDAGLLLLNLALLFCIAFQPYPTDVMGQHGDQLESVVFYACTLTITGIVVLAMWVYATRDHRLVSKDLSARLIRHHTWRASIVPAVFATSIPLAFASASAARYWWLLIALGLLVVNRVFRGA